MGLGYLGAMADRLMDLCGLRWLSDTAGRMMQAGCWSSDPGSV
jgi:hypothetical protein